MSRRHGRRAAAALLALVPLIAVDASVALGATVQRPAAPHEATSATTGGEGVEIEELDLSGVSRPALGDLPSPDSVPDPEAETETEVTPGPEASAARSAAPSDDALAAGPDAPAVEDPAATPAPSVGTEPAPAPTEGPTGQPSAEPSTAPQQDGPVPADPDVLTAELDTAAYSVLGVTWDRAADLDGVVVRYRVRVDGEWSSWEAAGAADVKPDPTGQDAASDDPRDGTDPIVAVGADGLQIWAEAAEGRVTGLKAVLIDPGADPATTGATIEDAASTADGVVRTAAAVTPAAVRSAVAPAQPAIISRAGWGADESLRTCSPDYSNDMVSAAVHHTASSNAYSAADVPGLLRGFYAYHTRPEASGGRGWCDIGYNFLVDRFGRIFEGRAGGVGATVVGVHTGGFNSRTIGVAAIGDFSTGTTPALLESISQLIAWKFSVHGILANDSVTMTSGGGASKWPAGTAVTFPTIYAHRDAQLTSCPGQSLYDALPSIRARVAAISDASVAQSPRGKVDSYAAAPGGVRITGWAFDRDVPTQSIMVQASVDGVVQNVPADLSRPDIAQAFGVGDRHGFSAVVPAGNGSHVVCVTALNLAGGGSTVLGCRWVTVSDPPPIGWLDSVTTTPTSISVEGWALDPDTTQPIGVHVYVDGAGAAVLTADGSRPDVGQKYGKGDAHGFRATVPATGGSHQVCVYAIGYAGGGNTLLGCRTVAVGSAPFGVLDHLTANATSISLDGWVIDRDTPDTPVSVHVYVDGVGAGVLSADRSRPDVGRAHGLGDDHGFAATIAAKPGPHQVCLYAINQPSGPTVLLACRVVTVQNAAPHGWLDSITPTATGVTLDGWVLDPDTTEPVTVHVYVDGKGAGALTANRSRPDVGRAYGLGDDHGYLATVAVPGGTHEVCLYGINQPAGANVLLACRTVTVGAAPFGTLDSATGVRGGIALDGWVLDPDSTSPVTVHVYVDGAGAAVLTANGRRADVDRAYGRGPLHGYTATVPAAAGPHQVCLYGLNLPSGPTALLACRVVTVP